MFGQIKGIRGWYPRTCYSVYELTGIMIVNNREYLLFVLFL